MPADLTTALFVTDDHFVECDVATEGVRLLDLLNAVGTDFLHVRNVRLLRDLWGEPLAEIEDAVLPKARVRIAMLKSDRHEAPERRQNAYASKNIHDAFMTVGCYEVRGHLHLKGHADAIAFLTSEASTFVPLTDATVDRVGQAMGGADSTLVIVNKARMDLLRISDSNQDETDDLLASIREMING